MCATSQIIDSCVLLITMAYKYNGYFSATLSDLSARPPVKSERIKFALAYFKA